MSDEMIKVAEGVFETPGNDLNQGYLVGGRCRGCGLVTFPKRPVCPRCLETDTVEPTPLSRKGRLYSFAVNRMAPAGFKAPYISVKVDLEEKVRVFGPAVDVPPEEDALEIGQEMEIVFGPMGRDGEGREMIGYMFRPVGASPREGA